MFLTSVADINAAIFTREKLKEREEQELKRLRQKLNGELSSENLCHEHYNRYPKRKFRNIFGLYDLLYKRRKQVNMAVY